MLEQKQVMNIEDAKSLKKHILIVEDNELNARLYKEILSRFQFDHIIVSDAESAIEKIKNSNDIYLVLMDIGLPKMSGKEALVEIKKIKPDLPVIAQTAYFTTEDQFKYKNLGFNGFIAKPINFGELLEMITEYQASV